MPRTSVRAERQAEIVQTFTTIAAEVGIANVTLRLVAERMGVTTPLLLHHFESRDAIVEAFFRSATSSIGDAASSTLKATSDDPDGEALLHYLFDGPYHELLTEVGDIWIELQAEMVRNDQLMATIRKSFHELEKRIADYLARVATNATSDELADTAHGLISLVQGAEVIDRMGFPNAPIRRAKSSASAIVRALIATSHQRQKKRYFGIQPGWKTRTRAH